MPTNEYSALFLVNVLLTGASGFVGCALLSRLQCCSSARRVVAVSRRQERFASGVESVQVEDCGPDTPWKKTLAGIDVVIHAAARVHRAESGADALAAFRRVNTAGTLNLARQAAAAGVRRVVFVSTIKVNGEQTLPGQPFRAADEPAPLGPYAVSKREAEDGLRSLSRETGIEIVIVRPPLVYGPGVRANFLRLMQWMDRGLPLPLPGSAGAPPNLRSLIGLGNLADLLMRCAEHPAAAGGTFLGCDGEDISTEELARRLARELGKTARLIAVPPFALGMLPGGAGLRQRLFGSLQMDASPARELLGWVPPFDLDAGLAETVRWYRARHRSQG